MRVSGYHMNRFLVQKPIDHLSWTFTPMAGKRISRDLNGATLFREMDHAVSVALQHKIPLRMRNDRPNAHADQPLKRLEHCRRHNEVTQFD